MPRFSDRTLRPVVVCLLALLLTSPGIAAAEPPPATRPEGGAHAFAPVSVGFLVLEGVYNSELVAPYDIFHHVQFHAMPAMEVFTIGREKGTVRTFEGLRIVVDHDLESAPPIDVLVVPSAEHNMDTDLDDERLIAWVRERGTRARTVLSICDGAFLLAEAGLLDGRRCTTFPGDIAAFRARYPQLTVVDGVRYVADGPTITGVGGAKSYEPALHLVERMYGKKAAQGVARGMVIDWDGERERRLVMPAQPSARDAVRCYLPGDRVDDTVTVENAAGDRITLREIIASRPGTRAVVLTIIAGAEATPRAQRGGIWCEDSYAAVPALRYLRLQYAERGVLFVGVMCPPVHHETEYGYDAGSFLTKDDDDPVYTRNRRLLVTATQALEQADALPFDVIAFDPRFRLLADPTRGETSVGPRPDWQGRFKWFEDTQTYGTPTTWILDAELNVPTTPFFMNVYESDGRKIRYTARDMEQALERVLSEAPRGAADDERRE